MKKTVNIFIVLCMIMSYLSGVVVYAEPQYELELSAQAAKGIGGWTGSSSSDQNKCFDSFRIGGTGSGIVEAYKDANVGDGKNSKDVKVGVVRFDLGYDNSSVTKYELKLSGGWAENNRNGDINVYIALADVNSTVISGKTPIGESWTTVTWNDRPQLLTGIDSAKPDTTITPAQDVRIDITELLKGKTGSVSIAVLGEKAGSTDGDMSYGLVQLIRTSPEFIEPNFGIKTDFTDSSALEGWSNTSSTEFGTDATIGSYAAVSYTHLRRRRCCVPS